MESVYYPYLEYTHIGSCVSRFRLFPSRTHACSAFSSLYIAQARGDGEERTPRIYYSWESGVISGPCVDLSATLCLNICLRVAFIAEAR